MIDAIQLTPNMDQATMINAINDAFRQIQSQNRTLEIKDEDGVSRILIGRWPNGVYGLMASKPGKNVLEYKDFV